MDSGTYVVLDTEVTVELEAEGYARYAIRAVQDARKNAGLDVADWIDLTQGVPAACVAWVQSHRDFIATETLSLGVEIHEIERTQLEVTVSKHS